MVADGISGSVMHPRLRNLAIFLAVIAIWLGLDIASKTALGGIQPGTLVAGPFLGVFQIAMVHNTGAAWGVFGDGTLFLGILSLIVCCLIVVYMFVLAPNSPPLQAFGLSLVVAGGLGNAIDRFLYGYVIDFIEPVFIDFPVFNIADIGVTCGVIIFLASLAWDAYKKRDPEA